MSAATLGLARPRVEPLSFSPTADDVYLDSDEERQEYVLTQQGFVYQGSAKFIKSIPWNFGQVGPHPAPSNHLRLLGPRPSKSKSGSSHCDSAVMNPTSNHEDAGSLSG